MNNSKNKIGWRKIIQAVVQAIVAALTALGVSSCAANF
ncbi:smalltalk protein [Odoribacter lunatus]|nr:smalltalk protein [Odoribacter lunatus]